MSLQEFHLLDQSQFKSHIVYKIEVRIINFTPHIQSLRSYASRARDVVLKLENI